MSEEVKSTPKVHGYSASELMALAVAGMPLDAQRVLATYADESNWVQLYKCESAARGYAPLACEWAFIGPTRPGFELAHHSLKDCLGLLFLRCTKHYKSGQINRTEYSGGECGACIAEERDRLTTENTALRDLCRESIEQMTYALNDGHWWEDQHHALIKKIEQALQIHTPTHPTK